MKTFYTIKGGVNAGTLLNTSLISTIQVDEVRAVIGDEADMGRL